MSFFDRLLGRGQPQQPQQQPWPNQPGYQQPPQQPQPNPQASYQQPAGQPAPNADQQAIQRYQYLLQTANPADIERVHAEAFAKLTPQQRQEVLGRLSAVAPDERPAGDSPQALARAATRAEMRQPGTLTNAFGGMMGGGRMGGMGGMGGLGGSLLTSVAGTALGIAAGYGLVQGIDAMFGDGIDGAVDGVTGLADQAGEAAGNAADTVADQAGGFAEDATGFADQAGSGDPFGGGFDNGSLDGGGFDNGSLDGGGFDGGGFDDGGGLDFGGEF